MFVNALSVGLVDGESAELCSLEILKENGSAPSLDIRLRCFLHANQRHLENAVMSDPNAMYLLDKLMYKLSAGRKDPGALARAIRNSERLKHKFGDCVVQGLTQLSNQIEKVFLPSHNGGVVATSSAPQRFASILEILETLSWWFGGFIFLICTEAASKDSQNQAWGLTFVEFFQRPEGWSGRVQLATGRSPCGVHLFSTQVHLQV